MVVMCMNIWISVLLAKNTHCYYVINNLEREFNFSESLKMDIVKMSPLTILLAEKRERRNEEKKSWPFYLLPPSYASSVFFLFFSYIASMETTREAKTPLYRASSDDAFLERVCSSFFLLCAQAYVTTHSFLVFFFARVAYTARPKQRKARSLSLPLSYSYIYTQQKSSWVFFFE
jgi:hypothetical protein